MDPSLKVSLMGHCVICLRKVRDDGDAGDGKGEEKFNVTNSSKFATTFNEFWTLLKGKGGDHEIAGVSLTSALNSTGQGAVTYFSVAPTLCQQCGEKVVTVENLMKAVRQQIREVEMLLVKSRRKGGGRIKEFEKYLRENGVIESVIESTLQFVNISGQVQGQRESVENLDKTLEPEEDEMQVKEEDPSWHGQEPATGPENIQETLSLKITTDFAAEESMECDEDISNFLDDGDDNNEEGDKSNWAWDEDDPDYIKSEEDDDDDDEETNDEEDEEEIPLEDIGLNNFPVPSSSFGVGVTTYPLDPLATRFTCPFEGCNKIFLNYPAFQTHKEKCPLGRPQRETKFMCDFPDCEGRFALEAGLKTHKEKSHVDPDSYKFPCSCGKAFPTDERRFDHQRRQKDRHPDFKPRIGIVASGKGQQCDMCGELVEFKDIFDHVKDHVGEEYVLRCPNVKECKHMFSNMRELMYHFLRAKGKNCKQIGRERNTGLMCEACGFVGNNAQVIRTHLTDMHERDHREKKLRCPISGCGKMFCLRQSVHCHLHVHQKKKVTKQNCDRCGKGVRIEEMGEHLKDKHGIEKAFGCRQCEMKFSGRYEMVEHLYEHRFAGLTCDVCGDKKPVKYFKYSEFREHYFGEHKLCPKRYKCGEPNCDFAVWRRNDLGAHVHDAKTGKVIKPELKKKVFKCEVCFVETTFTTEKALLSHKIKVHGEDPFRCDICGETFHDKQKFSKHKKEHDGKVFQKEWKCEVEGCGRIFTAKKGLKLHTANIHMEEKKHVCEECGKGYAFPQGLKTHRESVHLGLKPFVCEECGEGFASGNVLKRHKLIHTGERPFECDICGQRFRHKEVLRRHKVAHEKKGAEFKPNGPMKQIRKRKAQ